MPDTEPIVLDFFGLGIGLTGADREEIAFRFGPHLRRSGGDTPRLLVEIRRGGAEPDFLVRRADGTPLLRRAFRDWGNLPPAVPPFAALRDRYCLTPAVVLARHGRSVALLGGPYGEQANVAAALARRGWAFVSGRLLVLDRRTGHPLPYLAPLEARGAAAAWLRGAGLPEGAWRTVEPPGGGAEVLQVRPEGLGPVVPLHARPGPPTLVRLCRAAEEEVRLTPGEYTTRLWPADAADALAGAPALRLHLPDVGWAEEAAGLIDHAMTEEPCPDVPAVPTARRAGLTASLPI
ncbi:hypothetical protein [Streptomyces sp. NRRL WC-3742]|uniref:hypothetical protein n=1 Tax=Streptomyces sp. NRRL WC-3742 TaxID=1463934 RepID=UPI0004C8B5B6|nr:hypothetical protein [Streptomyces sp. NRRL WC-3742]